jgi:hypothetical protein
MILYSWIVEKDCSYSWVGVCASENFDGEAFADYRPTGWGTSSIGYYISFGDGAKIYWFI